MNTNRPDPLRCAATVLLSLTCAALLIELDSTTDWPATDPSAFLDWWERLGTAGAAITLLRIVGITLAGWGIFIGTAGLLASIRPSGPAPRRLAPHHARFVQADPRRGRHHHHALGSSGRSDHQPERRDADRAGRPRSDRGNGPTG